MKAVAWLRARALGCRHQVPPHPHPPIEPFDPSMCASVLHSLPELGGGRHRPTGPFAQFRADIQGAIPQTRGQPQRFLGGLEPPARLGLSLPHWRHQFRMQRRDARAWNRCRQVRGLDTSLIFGPSQWSCRESKPSIYQAKWRVVSRFVTSRSRSVPLVTCGFVFGS